MDFLRLFPASSQESPLLFSTYRKQGLLCWSAAAPNELVLVSALQMVGAANFASLSNEQQLTNKGQASTSVLFKTVTVCLLK
jgi:hypothetical protein